MFTIIGVLLILISVGLFILNAMKPKGSNLPSFISQFNWKKMLIGIVLGIVLTTVSGIFMYAEGGTAYLVQYLWGGTKIVNTNGYTTIWWGKVIPINYEIAVKDLIPKDYKAYLKDHSLEGEDAYIRAAALHEFNDAVNGNIGTNVVVNIDPNNEEKFTKMALANKSENNLVHSRIMGLIDASKKNTAKLMSAQEYISGKSADYDRMFRDQLEYGTYVLEEVKNPHRDKVVADSSEKVTVTADKNQNKLKTYKPKVVNGKVVRDGDGLREYGLLVRIANSYRVDWEPSFDKRLGKQKALVAETQEEKQKAEKAFYATKRAFQEAETNKAVEQGKLEKQQIQKTMAAETKAKVAIFELDESKTLLEKAKIDAKTMDVAADAKARKNRKLVAAGLTPQEKLKGEISIKIGVAKELAKIKLPQTVITTGKSNGSNLLEQLIGAQMAKDMLPK